MRDFFLYVFVCAIEKYNNEVKIITMLGKVDLEIMLEESGW